ncbi:uncharacterized protein EV154DRAFT_426859, partial [Mucor mucedo]|uniref:uncharacterized protein n=1 Tax=Mucor mucedo TaxID=29922 RepID=UPI00221E61BB
LQAKFYQGLNSTQLSSSDTTRFKWGFAKSLDQSELDSDLNSTQLSSSDTTRFKWGFAKSLDQSELDSVRGSVDSMTALSRGEDKLKRRANVGPSMPPPSMPVSKGDQRKYEQKKQKEMRQAILDEVAPRETGREAQIAKKHIRRTDSNVVVLDATLLWFSIEPPG